MITSTLCSAAPAAAAEADSEQLILELTGAGPAVPRNDKQWEAAYAQVIEALLTAPVLPGQPQPSPQKALLLEQIILRAAAPGAEAQRPPLVRAMLAYFEKTDRLNDRIFLLRQLAVAGRDESVPALTRLLGHENEAVRQYALRALTANTAASAGTAILAALQQAEQPERRVPLVNALGGRREAAAADVLTGLCGDANEKVAAAALMALGSIGTPEAAKALRAALSKASLKLSPVLIQASLLCADRLAAQGQKDTACALYKEVYATARPSYLRMAAVRGLVLAQAEEALPLVIEALKGNDERAQAQAARLALEIRGEDAAKKLRSLLPQLPASAQAFLSEALAERGESSPRK